MARYREIRTGIRSAHDIERALGEMGLARVEVHDVAQPLTDWIGRPTAMLANVIVRRADLGAASDDLGFVRNQDGTFDMLVSEIHLFRFDKKWMAEFAARTGAEVRAGSATSIATSAAKPVPKAAPIQATTSRPRAQPGSGPAPAARPPPETPREPNAAQRARLESAMLLDAAKKSQSLGRIGCLLYFVPVIPTLLFASSPHRGSAAAGLLVMWVVWSMVYFFVVAIVLTVRFQRRAREFARRFPTSDEARTAAIGHLRAIAHDRKNAASATARRLLTQLDPEATATITRLLPKQPRGPGGSGR